MPTHSCPCLPPSHHFYPSGWYELDSGAQTHTVPCYLRIRQQRALPTFPLTWSLTQSQVDCEFITQHSHCHHVGFQDSAGKQKVPCTTLPCTGANFVDTFANCASRAGVFCALELGAQYTQGFVKCLLGHRRFVGASMSVS